jgi:hypothetical protein
MIQIREFLLAAMSHAGALIEDVGFNRHEILLSEELAKSWQMPTFLTMTFDETHEHKGVPCELITYGHPLLEKLVQDYRTYKAHSRLYATGLRLQKQDLADLARHSISLPKGRINHHPSGMQYPAIFHYIRFFFRVAIISDEKYEHLIHATINAQSQQILNDEAWDYQVTLDPTPDWHKLPDAPLTWSDNPPICADTVAALLDKAIDATTVKLNSILANQERRLQRFRELDLARLDGYYADLQKDLQNRINYLLRKHEFEKHQALLDKMQILADEKESKIRDIQDKYELKIHLELCNILIIEQPKIVLDMVIERGNRKMPVQIIWDPLFQCLEPLKYDAQALAKL